MTQKPDDSFASRFDTLGGALGSLSTFAFLCTISVKTALTESGKLWPLAWILAAILLAYAIFYWVRTSVIAVEFLIWIERRWDFKLANAEVIIAGLATIFMALGVVVVTLKGVLS